MATYIQTPYTAFLGREPIGQCVPRAVAVQAMRTPKAVAVTSGNQVLTYDQLTFQANRLARRLRGLGVSTDVPVGLCTPRSMEFVVGALAILEAGGAYVLMDPAYPPDRLAFLLEDSGASVVVTHSSVRERLPTSGYEVIQLDLSYPADEGEPSTKTGPLPEDLAYIVYTSGSTGRPKGVEITHAGLANLVDWHDRAFDVTPADRASHLAGLGFDASVWELWPYLTAGASVHMVDDAVRCSPELLRNWLLETGITIAFVPTAITERLLLLDWSESKTLRYLLTGGEALRRCPPPDLPFRLVNNYGPSECAVVATSGELEPTAHGDGFPSIGTSITNTRIYLLDEEFMPVQSGSPGEIYVAGSGVGRGYHNRPDLTAERFLPDPFLPEGNSRMYRTGDVARLLPDGQFEFLGRTDDQIKLRGYRIEPREIMGALRKHPGVRECLVMAREDTPGNPSLAAYVVLDPEVNTTFTELCDFLRKFLPHYMIPASFVRMEAFPLTLNGKVDRAELPAPSVSNTLQDLAPAEPPASATETRIGAIVSELLGRETIGLQDDFFLLGGHSLLGAQLIARVREAFHCEISLRNLFASPSVAGLAAEVDRIIRTPGAAPATQLLSESQRCQKR